MFWIQLGYIEEIKLIWKLELFPSPSDKLYTKIIARFGDRLKQACISQVSYYPTFPRDYFNWTELCCHEFGDARFIIFSPNFLSQLLFYHSVYCVWLLLHKDYLHISICIMLLLDVAKCKWTKNINNFYKKLKINIFKDRETKNKFNYNISAFWLHQGWWFCIYLITHVGKWKL